MEPIEEYLDELYARLGGATRDARRVLEESAAHLRDAAGEGERAGLSRVEAEQAAVARFGSPAHVAGACARAHGPSPRQLVVDVAHASVLLGGLGLVGVGLSGAVVAALNAIFGYRFVGALPGSYSPAACRHFLAAHPGAGSCARAAVLENGQDAVSLRILAGLAGLVLLALGWAWRRRSTRAGSRRALAPVLVDSVAAAAFAAGAVLLAGQSVDLAVQTGSGGVGFYLSGAVIAAVGAVLFATRAARAVLAGHALVPDAG